MKIILTSNNKFFLSTLTTIFSFSWNNRKTTDSFYILTIDKIKKLYVFRSFLVSFFLGIRIEIIPLLNVEENSYNTKKELTPITSSINKKMQEQVKHLKFEAFLRLYIPYIFDDDEVIYLDSDILILGDITELKNTRIEQPKVIAGVHEKLPDNLKKNLSLLGLDNSQYINSGVMKINLKSWLQIIPLRKEIDEIIQGWNFVTHPAHDQDLINDLFRDRIVLLPLKYNTMTVRIHEERFPKIVHFTGGGKFKPWHPKCTNRYTGLYWKYRFVLDPLGFAKFYLIRVWG